MSSTCDWQAEVWEIHPAVEKLVLWVPCKTSKMKETVETNVASI